MIRLLSASVVIISILASVATPAGADALDDDHFLSMEFVTPHTDWAQPYALGKIRALFFSNGRGTEPREMVELMQRFNIEADAVFNIRIIDSANYEWLGGEAGHRRMLRLLEQPYDVYIFNRIPLTGLTAEEQYKVLRPVAQGAGIVFIGSNDERVLKPEHQLKELPPFLARGPVGDAFAIGKGRGIRLPNRPSLDYHVGWEVEYDYWQERLGRAVLWAAGRAPDMALRVAVEPAELDRANLPAEAIALDWSNAPAGVTLEVNIRRWDGEKLPVAEPQVRTPQGADVRFTIPVLRAGEYHVDVRAKSRRGVEAWATAPFTVTSPRIIEAVNLDSDWGEIGESISGNVQLAGPPAARGESVVVRLMDRRGRILARKSVQGPTNVVPFDFAIEPWMPMLLRVEAAVMQGGQEAASAYSFFRVTKRHRDQWNFLVWDCPRGTLAPYGEESLARLGTTLQLSGGNPPIQLAAYDIAWVPYTTRIMAPKDENGVMKPMCWNDEPAVDEYVQTFAEKYAPAREHGVYVYSLGDETVTRGSCLSPQCLRAYQDYLAEAYGDIAALNASWGTDFARFTDVTLSKSDDNDEAESLRRKNYSRWYDRQAFQCYNFVQFCQRFADVYDQLDPEARTGFEGAGRFSAGDDLDLIVRKNGFWSPYPGTADEVVRSIAPPDFPRANWMGYTKDADSLLSKYWRMVTRGMTAVWWWRWDALGRFNGFLAPHLGPFPATKDLAADTKVVRDGLGTLLMRSEMLDDGIAILYSMPSAYATRVEAGPSYGSYEDDHKAWHAAIWDLGLQFRYVTDRMLRLGEFDADRYRTLILPRTEAIGPESAKVIRAFAEGGGTVIADARVGLYDGHCKPLEKGSLDDLFGVERVENAEATTGQAKLEGAFDGRSFAVSWDAAKSDPGVRVADGSALGAAGETPLCVVKRVGKGRAVLLNFAMSSFPSIKASETPEAAADFVASLFARGGVEPTIRVTDAKGKRTRNVQVVRWQNGDAELVALFRETGEPGRATVQLREGRNVYDLRHHKALGRVKKFKTPIIPCRATFFAMLPKACPKAEIVLDKLSARPGDVVTARLTVPGAVGKHALRIRAKTPDGAPAEWWNQVVIVGPDGADVALPVAFNDPTGNWTVSAVDLFTEKATTAELTVR